MRLLGHHIDSWNCDAEVHDTSSRRGHPASAPNSALVMATLAGYPCWATMILSALSFCSFPKWLPLRDHGFSLSGAIIKSIIPQIFSVWKLNARLRAPRVGTKWNIWDPFTIMKEIQLPGWNSNHLGKTFWSLFTSSPRIPAMNRLPGMRPDLLLCISIHQGYDFHF